MSRYRMVGFIKSPAEILQLLFGVTFAIRLTQLANFQLPDRTDSVVRLTVKKEPAHLRLSIPNDSERSVHPNSIARWLAYL